MLTVEVKLTTLVQMTDLSFLTICSSSVFSHRSKVWNLLHVTDFVTVTPSHISQANNAGSDPRGRRWPKDIISICLQLYNRSPLAYNSLRDSGILILPSPSLLILY
jgi:hypothetical protein